MWVSIIEKCYAKKCGSYCAIENGVAPLFIKDLTGAPYKCIFLEKVESVNLVKLIRASLESGFLVSLNNLALPSSWQFFDQSDVQDMFAYPIVGIYETESITSVEYVLKIRNYWHEFQWKGDWSRNSIQWTDRARKQI